MHFLAKKQRSSYVERAYPVRYWLFVLYAIGVPAFVRFDETGLTHNLGLFNPWSIATIVLTCGAAFTFLLLTMLSGSPILAGKVNFASWIWLSLLGLFLLSTFLEPNFVVQPKPETDLYLSIYRLGEWVLAFSLFLCIYTREPRATSGQLVAGIVGRICWGWIAIVWCVLPIAPSFAYSGSSEAGPARLGGYLIPPGSFAIIAGIACFHALTCLRGSKRTLAFFFAATTLAMTYVRAEEIVFLLALILYAIFFARALPKLMGIFAGILALFMAAANWSSIMDYLKRGNGLSNITTLSERTDVWDAAFKAFWQRPYIGYGFIAGVKGALRDNWKWAHWVPPHAHNEWIQALLAGGILAALLLVLLYGKAIISAIRVAHNGPAYILFLFAIFQLTINALLGPVLVTPFSSCGILFGMSFIAVVDQDRTRKQQSTRVPATVSKPAFAMASPADRSVR